MYSSDEPSAQTSHAPPVFCSTCGQRLQPDWQFCTRCGVHIHPVVTDTSYGAAATEPQGPGSRVAWGVGDVALGTGFYIIQAISILAIVLVVARVADVEYRGVPLLVGMLLAQLAQPVTVWFFAVSRRRVRWSALGFWRKPALRDAGWGIVVLVAELTVQVVYYLILEAAGVDTGRLVPHAIPGRRYGIRDRASDYSCCAGSVYGGVIFQRLHFRGAGGAVGAGMGGDD